MKPSLMWALAWPNSNGNTMRGLCPRWDAQAVMATRWNMSIKRHSPPAGRYVQELLSVPLKDVVSIRSTCGQHCAEISRHVANLALIVALAFCIDTMLVRWF